MGLISRNISSFALDPLDKTSSIPTSRTLILATPWLLPGTHLPTRLVLLASAFPEPAAVILSSPPRSARPPAGLYWASLGSSAHFPLSPPASKSFPLEKVFLLRLILFSGYQVSTFSNEWWCTKNEIVANKYTCPQLIFLYFAKRWELTWGMGAALSPDPWWTSFLMLLSRFSFYILAISSGGSPQQEKELTYHKILPLNVYSSLILSISTGLSPQS